jgi:hypothetical protein
MSLLVALVVGVGALSMYARLSGSSPLPAALNMTWLATSADDKKMRIVAATRVAWYEVTCVTLRELLMTRIDGSRIGQRPGASLDVTTSASVHDAGTVDGGEFAPPPPRARAEL